ncbi:hypothetical protein BsWGS_03362 [Bradybaena similaris]
MESQSLLQCNSIKLEPACEDNNILTFNKDIVSEVIVCDKMDDKVPACVKTEQPEVSVDYPGDDVNIFDCSQSCPIQQEQSQVEKKAVFGNIDWKFVKPELSGFSKMVGMASCCSIKEMSEHNNTESTLPKDTTTPAHHQEVSLIINRAENGYTASQLHENGRNTSESVYSVIEDHTKICLTNENCQLHNIETPVKHTHISRKSLDYTFGYTSCSTQRMQAGDTPHMSDICGVTVNVGIFLPILVTTNTQEKPYNCDDCGASFIEIGKLKCHIRTHTGEKPCDICAAVFTKAGHLKCYIKTYTGEKPDKCDVCEAVSTQPGGLKHHMRTHTGQKPFKCDVCGASFTAAVSLKYHMRTHTGEKPYTCDVCGASFTAAVSLKYHRRIHTGKKPYKCDVCEAVFTQSSGLKDHMRTHTGEKPYKCDVCGASFTVAVSLKNHMRIHTGEKPYKCDVSEAVFTQPGGLKRHMRTHTGEKPYKCDVCGASFTEVVSLKYHMRSHAGEKP